MSLLKSFGQALQRSVEVARDETAKSKWIYITHPINTWQASTDQYDDALLDPQHQ